MILKWRPGKPTSPGEVDTAEPAATIGVMYEPGLDLHEWETRWQELQDAAAEDRVQTLPEIVRLVEQMLRDRGFELEEPVTAEGEDADIIRDYLAARELAEAAERGSADAEDVEVALEDLRDIYDYIVQDRAPP
jgi:hypothetical protein